MALACTCESCTFVFPLSVFMMKYFRLLPVLVISISLCMVYFAINNDESPLLPKEEPNDWFFRQRAYPFHEINHKVYVDALERSSEIRRTAQSERSTGSWEPAGPVNIGGRITDVEMHASDLNTIYLGAASGGVFKSTDKGSNWEPIFDGALSLSIGDIAIAPSDKNIIYVGTGEANCGGGSLAYDGVGIYRSDNAGDTWDFIGLENSRNIGRMVVNPKNPDVLYVAAMGNLFANGPDRGIYKTTDGGQSWENVLYVSDSTGGIDVVIHPTHPDTIYAAMWERVRRPNRRDYGGASCGLYRSYDGGKNWVELTNGLPFLAADKGRIGIDIAESEPNILYAIYADQIGYFNGVYKTTDGGDSWSRTNDSDLTSAFASFGWWFGRIEVDPTESDIAFVIGFDIYRTQNGGNSWTNQSGWEVHVDQHAAYVHPLDNNFVVLGNDGGFYISTNGGNSWIWNETLPITQFYTGEVDNQMPMRLYGGAQDNGTNRTLTGELDDWDHIFGGDGFRVLVDPENNNFVYAESQYGGLGRSTNGGFSFGNNISGINSSDRFNWHCPLEFDPQDPSILYFGSNKLYKSTNRAATFNAISGDLTDGYQPANVAYNTITTISISPVNNQVIYAGTDDGNVSISQDDGQSWSNISEGLPKRWITRVVADPIVEARVYVTVSGYRWDEFLPHVFRSDDFGQSWIDISSNLPEAPVNDLIVNTPNNQILFVATDMGVYKSYNGGETWSLLGDNLPNVVVSDLVLHKGTNKLVAATYGRSMYSYDLEQDDITSVEAKDITPEMKVFPNPFSGFTHITTGMENVSGFMVFDRTAKLVYSDRPANGKNIRWDGCDMNGKKLPAGIYFISVTNSTHSTTEKVILY